MWVTILIIFLIVIICGLGYILYLLVEQNEQYEEQITTLYEWYQTFVVSIAEANDRMEQVDKRGSFSSDDEIGFAYKTIKDCIEQLNELGVISYDGEEGQTDSTEEIQGQEEEE